ncbi:hypothetical protein F5X98DRAFT_14582 [Xylaria grammica]|nr:hypothetical protein F5X98DRAFT_14582 [Xylaria grammica]
MAGRYLIRPSCPLLFFFSPHLRSKCPDIQSKVSTGSLINQQELFRFPGVMVITVDFDSTNLGSIPGETLSKRPYQQNNPLPLYPV